MGNVILPKIGHPKIAVSCPFPLDSPQGNVVSARRIAELLGAGVCHGMPEGEVDIAILLHARRSAGVLREIRSKWPDAKVVVVLTGTDLYRDIPAGDVDALWLLESADLLATYHEAAIADVPERFRKKARLGGKSLDIELPRARSERRENLLTVVQHLREVKDPFLTARAAPDDYEVVTIGRALEDDFKREARKLEAEKTNFRWLGERSRAEVLEWQMQATATVNSAAMEGGANAVIEAMFCGTPVLASRISGNVGLLGEDYPAYFDYGDRAGLRALIDKLGSGTFREGLAGRVLERSRLFTREKERESWRAIINELT